MNKKQIFILLGLFIILVGALLMRSKLQWLPFGKIFSEPVPVNFQPKEVDRIQIGRSNKVLVDLVQLSPGYWALVSFSSVDADNSKVNDFIEFLSDLRGEVRADGENHYKDFEITKQEAIFVELYNNQGKSIQKFYLGNKVPQGNHFFLRLRDSQKIYLTHDRIFPEMGMTRAPFEEDPTNRHWITKQFFKFYPPKAVKLSVTKLRGDKEPYQKALILRRQGGLEYARATIPFELDVDKIDEFVERAVDWVPERILSLREAGPRISESTWRMDIMHEGIAPLNIFFSKVHGDKVFVTTNQAPVVYKLSAFHAQNYMINDSAFFKDDIYDVRRKKVQKILFSYEGQEGELRAEDAAFEDLLTLLEKLRVRDIRVPLSPWQPIVFPSATNLRIFYDGQEDTPKELHLGEMLEGRDEYKARRRLPTRNFTLPQTQVEELLEVLKGLAAKPA